MWIKVRTFHTSGSECAKKHRRKWRELISDRFSSGCLFWRSHRRRSEIDNPKADDRSNIDERGRLEDGQGDVGHRSRVVPFHGYGPVDIRLGYGPRANGKTPPGTYVNASNPLAGLSVEQVKRVLTVGNPSGEVSVWGQLGVEGKWAHRVIHVYGLDPNGGGAISLRTEYLNGRQFTQSYESFEKPADVVRALAEDPYGIALLGYLDASSVSAQVKPLPVSKKEGDPFLLPSYEVVRTDRYTFPAYLHIYINREPGKSVDPFVNEYVRMVLSREGQAIIAGQKNTEEGYVPLALQLVTVELKKLD